MKWKSNIIKRTPLHSAAHRNAKKLGEVLLSKGADIDAVDIECQ